MKRVFSIFFVVLMALSFVGTGVAMAETHTKYMTAHPATDPGAGAKSIYFQSGIVDCNNTKYFGSGVTNADVIQLVKVPESTVVRSFAIRVTRAGAGNLTGSGVSATVGDGASAAGFVNNGNIATASYIKMTSAMTGASVWSLKAPSGTISGVSNAATSIYDNSGSYFIAGASPYIGRDTIDMTVYVDKTVSTGVTPMFEWMIECQKLPTATN